MHRGPVRLSRRALSAGALVALLATCGPAGPRRPDVLKIVVDTLRADHLSAWGYARPTSPRLDALAADALRFTHAQTPRAKTLPAVASLLTGLYPHDHGVRDNATRIPVGTPLLAEALAGAGYRTSAVVGNWVLQDARSGLARGFSRWDDSLPDLDGVPPDGVPQRRAASLTDAALAELQRLTAGDQPWLLYLHYMDPHGLYDPPPEHRLFDGAPPEPLPEPGPPDAPHQRRVAEFNVPPDCRLPDGRIDVHGDRGGAAVPEILAAAAAAGGFSACIAASTSPLTTRPPRPLPAMDATSIFVSSASLLAAGIKLGSAAPAGLDGACGCAPGTAAPGEAACGLPSRRNTTAPVSVEASACATPCRPTWKSPGCSADGCR